MGLLETFQDPPRIYSVMPFWFLNDDLDEAELKRQIDDFEAHGVYGFIPHARLGLPERIQFMSEAWLHYTKVCVDYAAQKGMFVILYDEGMYPSGSCAGRVVAENPRYAARCLDRVKKGQVREDWDLVWEDAYWSYVNRPSEGVIRGVHFGWDDSDPKAPPAADLLNPESTACFRRLVLDGHYGALEEHFGKTILAVFTDEPDKLGRRHRRGVQPWTWGFAQYLEAYLGYDFRPKLGALWERGYPDRDRYVHDFRRAVDARLQETYYAPYSQWCADHGVALTGHPAGPCDIGTEKFFHIPGQDIVWRYIEPYEEKSIEGGQSTMAKCSVSAQRHYGRERNANECYGAYGWEFTYDEMMYVTNWLFVRGVNMLFPHAFYYSVRGPRRDERPPDVGPNNVWWDGYKRFADYCRRLSWLLAQGRHVCSIAILGTATNLPSRAARILFESQHDFNYLDTDTLLGACDVTSGGLRIRDMHYEALVIDGVGHRVPGALDRLAPLIEAGRVIVYEDAVAGASEPVNGAKGLCAALDALIAPDVRVAPAAKGLRYTHMQHEGHDFYVFANEAPEAIEAALDVAAQGVKQWWDPMAAAVIEYADGERIELNPLEMRVLCVRA